MSSPFFEWPIRVYWEDTDAGGVVFYANYLKFFERARTECFRRHGLGQEALRQTHGVQLVVAEVACKYLQSARLDDALVATVDHLEAGRASLTFQQSIWRGQVLLSRSTIRVGCVDAKTLRPCRFPQPVLDALHNAATAKAG